MYLVALNNFDFITITILFVIVFGLAYNVRRKDTISFNSLNLSKYTFSGVIELVVFSMLCALFGFRALISIMLAVICIWMIEYICYGLFFHNSASHDKIASSSTSETEYVKKLDLSKLLMFRTFQFIGLLVLSIVTILITSKLLQVLVGWSFINSIVGLLGFTIIYMAVGGWLAVYYIQILQIIIVLAALIFVVAFSIYDIGGIGIVFRELKGLALNQGVDPNYYIKYNLFSWLDIKLFLGALIYIGLLKILLWPRLRQRKSKFIKAVQLPFSLCIIFLVSFVGIIAIATSGNVGSGNSKFVTYQAQLSNGEVAYIVRENSNMVNGFSKPVVTPGLVPPVIDSRTNLVVNGKYDYFLTFIVVLKYYLMKLSKYFTSLLMLVIFSAFMYSFSRYVMNMALFFTEDVFPVLGKTNYFIDLNSLSKLWIYRIGVVIVSIIAFLGAAILNKFI